jgi:hypothetical protein
MATLAEWSLAYAEQARCDMDAHAALCTHERIPDCQRLHFLQMACEKLCKAYLCGMGARPEDLKTSHAYLKKDLPIVLSKQYALTYGKKLKHSSHLLKRFTHFAREIELLAPAVDDGGRRPDNCEYPWEDGPGRLTTPARHQFPNLNFLKEADGRHFLKLIGLAVERRIAELKSA